MGRVERAVELVEGPGAAGNEVVGDSNLEMAVVGCLLPEIQVGLRDFAELNLAGDHVSRAGTPERRDAFWQDATD